MINPTLADQADRDRMDQDLDTNFFVEAGAGAGKTTQMVRRIRGLIFTKGLSVRDLAVITFTENAAAQLNVNLRTMLEAESNSPDPDHAATAQKALRELPGAAIQTLHSFCQGILADFPLEAGLPPAFTVESGTGAAVASWERAQQLRSLLALADSQQPLDEFAYLFDQHLTEASFRAAATILLDSGVTPKIIVDAAATMDSRWGELAATLAAYPGPRPQFGQQQVTAALQRLGEIIGYGQSRDGADKLVSALDVFRSELLALRDSATVDWAAADIKKPGGRVGAKKAWDGYTSPTSGNSGAKGARDEAAHIYAELEEEHAAPLRWATDALRLVLARFTVAAAAQRRRAGNLTFADLIFTADDLLMRDVRVRNLLRERYQALLVDEFQDTDPAQVRIVLSIAQEKETEPAAGGETGGVRTQFDSHRPLRPGALFVVGDPKQSIYSFRNADIDTYLEIKNLEQLEGLALSTNFRSGPAVLALVNNLFSQWFQVREAAVASDLDSAEGPEAMPRSIAYTAMEVAAKNADLDSCASVYSSIRGELRDRDEFTYVDGRGITKVSVPTMERADLLRAVADLAGRDGVGLGDITVLCKSHDNIADVTAILNDHGIPCYAEGSANIFRDPVVWAVHTVMRAASDPANSFATVAALRSPVMGCTDQELFDFTEYVQQAQPSYEEWAHHNDQRAGRLGWQQHRPQVVQGTPGPALPAPTPGVERVLEKLDQIRALQDMAAKGMPVPAFVDATLQVVGVTERSLQSDPLNDSLLRKLRFLKEVVASFTADAHGSLRDYLDFAEEASQSKRDYSEPFIDEHRPDAVRVSTIHSSKGLEYDAVVVYGITNLGVGGGSDGATLLYEPHHCAVMALRLNKDAVTTNFKNSYAYHSTAKKNEQMRLMYVAATRAKKYLAVVFEGEYRKGNKKDPDSIYGSTLQGEILKARDLAGCIETTVQSPQEWDELPALLASLAGEPDSVAVDFPAAQEKFTSSCAAVRAGARLPRRVAATHLAGSSEGSGERGGQAIWSLVQDFVPGVGQVPAVPARASMDRPDVYGTALHKAMELFDPTASMLAVTRQILAFAELTEQERQRLALDMQSFLAVPAIAAALADPRTRREVPVYGSLPYPDGRLAVVDGVVDLLYFDSQAAGWVIADYKSTGEVDEQTARKYRLQLLLYRAILAPLLREPIVRMELIYARDSGAFVDAFTPAG